ncbi:caspase family protein [Mesorhizobium sp. ES1-6]|uniref:caspase family protein n=1 Tax=Mesorhizobium sp. ES1-6 TaxID=2876626 RepID=UPI001CCA3E2F|nr:caspase family protein [Mesorhizobium sp. ES1-6]MBZ9801088.1 caspase family protein [Mesorhizobium sp. ES1-6]
MPITIQPRKRVALVVGNQEYAQAKRLRNPVGDAIAMMEALTRVGFACGEPILDADWNTFDKARSGFLRASVEADVALLFYAGHSIQVDGSNYLLPVDSNIQGRNSLKRHAFKLEEILTPIKNKAKTSIILLDGCRDDPFGTAFLADEDEESRAEMLQARGPVTVALGPHGDVGVFFATSEGQIASDWFQSIDGKSDHSPFCQAILQHIEAPGLTFQRLTTLVTQSVKSLTGDAQRPWLVASISDDIAIDPSSPTAASMDPLGDHFVHSSGSDDVHIAQTVHQLNKPSPYLGNDHAVSTRQFFREHQDSPFVGRSDYLGALDDWLNASDVSPNLLLCGPGGRGKSALLVQWIEKLKLSPEHAPNILFVPINRRQSLAKEFDFFPALAEGLSSFLPSNMPLPTEVEKMRAFAHRALEALVESKTPLLVIVDGLDEADGWSIGPGFLPARNGGHPLRVVVSARTEADDPSSEEWHRRLGWEENALTVHLGGLSSDEVTTLLTSATTNIPQPGELTSTVKHCDGDPLVTRIVAQQIRLHGFEDAARVSKGAEGLLNRVLKEWYERALGDVAEVTKPVLHGLVGALVRAKGPITRADLITVLDVSAAQVGEALRAVRTLLAGDAKAGYSFAHPKMADALSQVLALDDRQLEQGFLRLITVALVDADTSPIDVALYPLRHAAAHLSGAPDANSLMSALLCFDWLKAHQTRFGHVRDFLELVDTIAKHARNANARAASGGHLLPHSTLEFAAALWWPVAEEYTRLERAKLADHNDPDLVMQAVRDELDADLPAVYAPTGALNLLRQIRDQLHPDSVVEWQVLVKRAADEVRNRLFTYAVRNTDEALDLLTWADSDFNVTDYIGSLSDLQTELDARHYLLESRWPHDRSEQLGRIHQIAASTSSHGLKAEAAVVLAGMQAQGFDEAFETVLAFAATDHEAAKSAALMVEQLIDEARSKKTDLVDLEGILERFRSAVHDAGVEAPILGALLRHCDRNARRSLWPNIMDLPSWNDIGRVIEHGPRDWEADEVNSFTRMMGGFVQPPRESDRVSAPPEGGAHPAWRRAVNIADMLGRIIHKTDDEARRVATDRLLDNLESTPSYEWWHEPAKVLDDHLMFILHDETATDTARARATILANKFEIEKGEPLARSGLPSGIHSLQPNVAAGVVIEFINRWGGEGLKRAARQIELSSVDVAASLIGALDKLSNLELRSATALILSRNLNLAPASRVVARSAAGLPEANDELRTRRRENIEEFCELMNVLSVPGLDTTSMTLRWLINSGSDAQALLWKVNIPSGWLVPPDLHRRLASMLNHWKDIPGSYFPSAIAARMPLPQLLDTMDHHLAEKTAYIITGIFSYIEEIDVSSGVELKYISEIADMNLSFNSAYLLTTLESNSFPVIQHPDEWTTCRVAQLQRDGSASRAVAQMAHETRKIRHENLRQSFARWILNHLKVIDDPTQRAAIRYKLGDAPKQDEVEACRTLLAKSLAGEESVGDVRSVLPLLSTTDQDGRWQQMVDELVSRVGSDDFDRCIEALGDAVTLNNIRATLPSALHVVTYTGRIWSAEEYFKRLSEPERGDVFRAWLSELKLRGVVEDERRFVNVIANVAPSAFALELLRTLLGPETDQSYWAKAIVVLFARLTTEDAAELVNTVLKLAGGRHEVEFVEALISRLKPRDQAALYSSARAARNTKDSRSLIWAMTMRFPGLLDGNAIDEALIAAEADSGRNIGLNFIADAPAATIVQHDRAWSILMKRGRLASLGKAVAILSQALELRHALGRSDEGVSDIVMSAASTF